uniref:Uncharacterized protein n=1 Tax=Treubia lacunosa TaxID=93845 RepID=G4Y9R7_9MARC|nr:hypothetical protein TrlaMp18 [Treubia lacunosa]AEH99713.1 hypothetical protein TrlaMp18 [Treubia lacunosa]
MGARKQLAAILNDLLYRKNSIEMPISDKCTHLFNPQIFLDNNNIDPLIKWSKLKILDISQILQNEPQFSSLFTSNNTPTEALLKALFNKPHKEAILLRDDVVFTESIDDRLRLLLR